MKRKIKGDGINYKAVKKYFKMKLTENVASELNIHKDYSIRLIPVSNNWMNWIDKKGYSCIRGGLCSLACDGHLYCFFMMQIKGNPTLFHYKITLVKNEVIK